MADTWPDGAPNWLFDTRQVARSSSARLSRARSGLSQGRLGELQAAIRASALRPATEISIPSRPRSSNGVFASAAPQKLSIRCAKELRHARAVRQAKSPRCGEAAVCKEKEASQRTVSAIKFARHLLYLRCWSGAFRNFGRLRPRMTSSSSFPICPCLTRMSRWCCRANTLFSQI